MIAMVVGGEDMGEPPALPIQLALDFGRVGRVDGGRGAGLVVMQQKAVIVRTADELVDCKMCHAGEGAFLSIRVISLPAASMLDSDGYR